jgi:hypothetical protein
MQNGPDVAWKGLMETNTFWISDMKPKCNLNLQHPLTFQYHHLFFVQG